MGLVRLRPPVWVEIALDDVIKPDVIGNLDAKKLIRTGQVSWIDVKMGKNLQQSRGRMVGQIDDPMAAGMPSAGHLHAACPGEIGKIGYSPEPHDSRQAKMPCSMRSSMSSTMRAPASLARKSTGVASFNARFGLRSHR